MCVKIVKKKKGGEDKGIALFYFSFLKITTWYKITVTFGDRKVTERRRGDMLYWLI